MALKLRSRLKHAWIVLKEGVYPGIGDDIDSDNHLYRKLSQRAQVQDLESYTREQMIRMVRYLWIQNPMGRSIIELKKDYVVGDGLTFEAVDEDVQALCQTHWDDPVNRWGQRTHRFSRELLMWGEQILPVAVQEHTGRIRFGSINPLSVKEVVVDPLNVEVPIGVIIRSAPGVDDVRLKTVLVNFDDDDLSTAALELRDRFTDGQCFYFAINKLSNMTRGLSDIIQDVDIIDMYDECQFTRGEKMKMAGNYFFSCQLEGMSPEQVEEYQKKYGGHTPKPGDTIYHNDKVKYEVVAPDMKSQDFAEDMRRMKNYALAGVRLPEHFFGEGGDVNYATALSMHAPVNKAMKSSQNELEAMFFDIFRYVIHSAKRAGALPVDADESWKTFGFPEIDTKDLTNLTSALQQAVTAMSTARIDNVITDEEYRSVVGQMLRPFGVELTTDDISDELEDSANASDAQPYSEASISRAS